jgi:hypothetical protein
MDFGIKFLLSVAQGDAGRAIGSVLAWVARKPEPRALVNLILRLRPGQEVPATAPFNVLSEGTE